MSMEFVLYLFSPLLVPIAFAAVAAGGEVLVKAFFRS
jgi:hypothetical protein